MFRAQYRVRLVVVALLGFIFLFLSPPAIALELHASAD